MWARRGDSWDHACWGNGGRRVQGPEMLCEELGARANPAAFPVPLQWFPSATAVTRPQPCSSSSQSGSVTQQCPKAQVSTPNVPSSLGLRASRGLCQGRSNHMPNRALESPEIPLQGLPWLWVHKAHWSNPKAMGRNVCAIAVFPSTFCQTLSRTRALSLENLDLCNHHLLLVACISLCSPCTERGWMCCPKGWRRFQGSCYFLSTDTMSWAESAQNCTGMGSQLVVITSKAEQVSAEG